MVAVGRETVLVGVAGTDPAGALAVYGLKLAAEAEEAAAAAPAGARVLLPEVHEGALQTAGAGAGPTRALVLAGLGAPENRGPGLASTLRDACAGRPDALYCVVAAVPGLKLAGGAVGCLPGVAGLPALPENTRIQDDGVAQVCHCLRALGLEMTCILHRGYRPHLGDLEPAKGTAGVLAQALEAAFGVEFDAAKLQGAELRPSAAAGGAPEYII